MALEISVENREEFEELLQNGDLKTINSIVDSVINNLKGRRRFIHILDVNIKEDYKTYNLTTDRKDFKWILENYLPILEENECYEKCAEIMKALKTLNSKK